jgi:malonyl CoA-acyl carrier protein transacylase
MATEIYLRKLHHSFVPVDVGQLGLMEDLAPNSEFKAVLTQPRSLPFHRRFFALLDVAFDAWEPEPQFYKGVQIEKNRERFRKDIVIMAGYFTPVVNVKSEVRLEAKSISFAKMDQDEFQALYSRVLDIILQKILTHYTKDDIDAQVQKVLGFC